MNSLVLVEASMKRIGLILLILLLATSAWGQFQQADLIYGNRDGSPVRWRLGNITMSLPAWGSVMWSPEIYIDFLDMPLASDNRYITGRYGGYFPDTLVGLWDDADFLQPLTHDTDPAIEEGFTSQLMLAFAWLNGPPDTANWIHAIGDTVLICNYLMGVTDNRNLADSIIYPFREGHDPNNGGLLWATGGGTSFVPATTYGGIHLIGCENLPGDINNDSLFNGLDVVYSVNYLKSGINGPYCFKECGSQGEVAQTADANGDCTYNGLDVVYCVNYLKGSGPRPRFCADCPQIE